MKISILGSGRWASFLTWYTTKNKHDVMVWGRTGSKSWLELKENRKNQYVTLEENMEFTNDLYFSVNFAEIVLIAISAQQLRTFCSELKLTNWREKTFVLCMKGLEENTGLRLTQVMEECLPGVKTAVWVGPGHPQDFVKGIPNCMVIDSNDEVRTHYVADSLSSPIIKFYYGADLIGTEIGAGAKNVIGLAAGMLDGLGYTSLKGVLMARGAREISRLVKAMGGDEITVYGLSHLGDYEATLFSPYSHNRSYGEYFILEKEYPMLAEGVATTHSLVNIAQKLSVELPICNGILDVLNRKDSAKNVLTNLFLRKTKEERV